MNLLFVCTGNTCRSVMAEYYLKDRLEQLEISGINVSSAGVATMDGIPASQGMLAVLEELAIDASPHASRILTDEIARKADRIYALATGHIAIIESKYPFAKEKTELLGVKSVPDPMGLTFEEYKECLDIIIKAIETKIIPKLQK